MPRSLFCIAISLPMSWLLVHAAEPAPPSRPAGTEPSKATDDTGKKDKNKADVFRDSQTYFKYYLESSREQDIRCLWFLNDNIKVGMVMALDLRQSQVKTFRHVFAWAMQDEEERKLSHAQTTTVESLLPQLPPASAATETEFAKGLHIAFWKAGKPCLVSYPKSAVPRLVQRLYDIGGGPPDFTYVE